MDNDVIDERQQGGEEAAELPEQRGLTMIRAEEILGVHGPNTVPSPPPVRPMARVLTQLRDPMIMLLLGAAALAMWIGDVADLAIIGAVVVLNTTIGVVQERRAEQASTALTALTAPVVRVVRDGVIREVPRTTVVPGDLLAIAAGDMVPCDADLVEAHQFQVDEAVLTGESVPVAKPPGDLVNGGTAVTRGRGPGVATLTGADSAIGRVTSLIASSPYDPRHRRPALHG